MNRLGNCEFYGSTVEFILPSLLDMKPEAAVVDPPRAGLHASAAKALVDMAPPVLFYVSCNPEALARDLMALGARYTVDRLVCVDLFPHTDHVETVAWLTPKASRMKYNEFRFRPSLALVTQRIVCCPAKADIQVRFPASAMDERRAFSRQAEWLSAT